MKRVIWKHEIPAPGYPATRIKVNGEARIVGFELIDDTAGDEAAFYAWIEHGIQDEPSISHVIELRTIGTGQEFDSQWEPAGTVLDPFECGPPDVWHLLVNWDPKQ